MTGKAHTHGHAPETRGRTIRWWAQFYDAASWVMSFGQKAAMVRRTIAVAKLQQGERVLDVGCGPGSLTIPAAERVAPEGRVVGIDASPEMLEVARRKARKAGLGIDFRLTPVETLPFEDGELDVALSSLMLHHLPDDVKRQGLAEIFRVLKPGGRLVAVDLTGSYLPGSLVLGLFGHRMPTDYIDSLKAIMSAAGFEDVRQAKSKWDQVAFIRADKPDGPTGLDEEL